MKSLAAGALALALLSGTAGFGGVLAETPAERRGKVIAEKNCSPCHATGSRGASKNAKAPPLRNLSRRYKVENLEEAFAEGVTVSHRAQEMPAFELEPETIADLIAYLKRVGRSK